MKKTLLAMAAVVAAGSAFADVPERSLSLEAARIETIRIEGQVRTWVVDKVCIDGQAYLMVLGPGSPGAMTAAYKDGKPEQCRPTASK